MWLQRWWIYMGSLLLMIMRQPLLRLLMIRGQLRVIRAVSVPFLVKLSNKWFYTRLLSRGCIPKLHWYQIFLNKPKTCYFYCWSTLRRELNVVWVFFVTVTNFQFWCNAITWLRNPKALEQYYVDRIELAYLHFSILNNLHAMPNGAQSFHVLLYMAYVSDSKTWWWALSSLVSLAGPSKRIDSWG